MNRILLTGAAGGLGRVMRTRLKHLGPLRLSDIADLGPAADGEEIVPCDLADRDAVMRLVEGCDAVVHLGGVSVEDRFSKIVDANIVGLFNLYEAARAHGHPRILFASSNHTVGFYPQDETLDAACTFRPDGLYGVSKCFGEALARMYFEKFGQETAIVRIGSCVAEPLNHRMLSTWLSFDDFVSLVERVFTVPRLGCPIVWGASNNDRGWWDNSKAGYLGWRPKDNAEAFAQKLDAEQERPAVDSAMALYQGGVFTNDPIFPEA